MTDACAVRTAFANSSFRDAPLGAGPESITPDRGHGFSDVQLHIKARSFHSRPGMTG